MIHINLDGKLADKLMEKSIQYFIQQEREYLQTHSSRRPIFDDTEDDPLDFLEEQPFSSLYEHMQESPLISCDIKTRYNITDTEELMLFFMIHQYSRYFRYNGEQNKDSYPEVIQRMRQHWEAFLHKIPNCDASVLYRYCNTFDNTDLQKGDMWVCPFSLTAREEEWPLNPSEDIYEIHLLPNNLTRAKAVWKIYNHGEDCDNPEYQVNFLSNTKFHIDDVVSMDNGGKKIVMHERQ